MRLADFILDNIEPILAEWERFAHNVWPEPASVDPVELRDHAEAILRATVDDMRSTQSVAQRKAKSLGDEHDSREGRVLNLASQEHGGGRVGSGFAIAEVIAEYRALRASVVRLWRASKPVPDDGDLEDLSRFHESIDQSLAQAAESFTEAVDRARQLFLAILGHDLRNPLNAIGMTAELFVRAGGLPSELRAMAGQLARSSKVMRGMLNDLLEFAGAGLGTGMPVKRASMDLGPLCREVIAEIEAAYPNCVIRYSAAGDVAGQWDASRLRQVVSNLLGNAVQHSGGDCDVIEVQANGEDPQAIVLRVTNGGPPIPPAAIPALFDPLHRNVDALPQRQRGGSVGLGLYIVDQIVRAHGGSVDVTSTAEAGTTFTVRLPR